MKNLKSNVNFANLSVRFGERELLDYIEVISAAFLKDNKTRKYGKAMYHLYEVNYAWVVPDDPLSLVIYGHFVKSSKLEREQVLVQGRLVKDEIEIDTAPSAFFVFFVADHRLAYAPETKQAPPLSSFGSTIQLFIRQEFKIFIDKYYLDRKKDNGKFTRQRAYQDHVPPEISLVALTSRDSIDQFVKRFSKIEKLVVHIVKRNQDINGGDIFEALYGKSEEMGVSSSRFIATGGKDGLKHQATEEFIEETTAGGYEEVAIAGRDGNDNKLSGTNEDFKLSTPIELEGLPDLSKARKIFEAYEGLKDDGAIRVTKREANIIADKTKNVFPREN